MQKRYTNIAISGLPGAGSTTLLHRVRNVLAPYGWLGYSGGEYLRQFAPNIKELKHHSADAYSDSVDRMLDMRIREQLANEHHLIIESWLSGFLAQGIPQVLKVLIMCSNDMDRAERLARRDQMCPSDAIVEAYKRLETNTDKWARMYHQEWENWVVRPGLINREASIFFWSPRLYDVVIDTAVSSEQECLDTLLEALNFEPVLERAAG